VNWIEREAKKADPSTDRIVLENPKTVKDLDGLLRGTFLPFIIGALEKTGYPFSPSGKEASFTSEWLGAGLRREFVFLLSDHLQFPFFRGTFSCSMTGFLIEKTFTLGLSKDTDPSFLFRILGDPRFHGVPPTLTIQPSAWRTDWNVHYCIDIHAGDGMDTGPWTLHNVAKERLQSLIEDAAAMYEQSMVDGFETVEDVDEFLSIAERSFKTE
jgi:hypothetical protein